MWNFVRQASLPSCKPSRRVWVMLVGGQKWPRGCCRLSRCPCWPAPPSPWWSSPSAGCTDHTNTGCKTHNHLPEYSTTLFTLNPFIFSKRSNCGWFLLYASFCFKWCCVITAHWNFQSQNSKILSPLAIGYTNVIFILAAIVTITCIFENMLHSWNLMLPQGMTLILTNHQLHCSPPPSQLPPNRRQSNRVCLHQVIRWPSALIAILRFLLGLFLKLNLCLMFLNLNFANIKAQT